MPRLSGGTGPIILLVAASAILHAGCASSSDGELRVRTIAFLRAVESPNSTMEETFLSELRQAGFVPGRTLRVLGGAANEAYPEPEEASEALRGWVAEGAELVVALSSSGASVARRVAPDVNILFVSNDPVASGLVRDPRRPDGRLTGVTFRIPDERLLTVAQRMLPGLVRVGMVYPEGDRAAIAHRDRFAAAAEALQIELASEVMADRSDVPRAVDALVGRDVQALMISTTPTAMRLLADFESAANRREVPVIAGTHLVGFALVALYPDHARLGSQLGVQAVRLLNGESPDTVAVQDPSRFRLAVSMAAAAALGVEIPTDLLREADLVRR